MSSKELLKGSLATIILRLLAERGKMYGYEITQEVKRLTDDRIVISEGALYPNLHKLEKEGLVITERVYIGKRVRKYYTLTEKGAGVASERVNSLMEFIQTLTTLLKPTTAPRYGFALGRKN